MKEIFDHAKDKTEVSVEQSIEKQRILIGKLRPHKGHTIWEVNVKTGEYRKAEFKKQVIDIGEAISKGVDFVAKKREIDKKDDCIYVSALNESSLKKKLRI